MGYPLSPPIAFTAIRWRFLLPPTTLLDHLLMNKNNLHLVLGVLGICLCLAQPLDAQNAVADDIEHTRAFLVKLKPGSASTRAAVDDDWQLTPLVTEAQTRGNSTAVGNWWYLAPRSRAAYVRSSSSSDLDWDAAYDLYIRKTDQATRGPDSRAPLKKRGIDADKIEFIEPDLGYFLAAPGPSSAPAVAPNASAAGKAAVGSPPSRHWPQFSSVGAYQEDNYSQLKSARDTVAARAAETHSSPVRIAFLDTGYDPRHVACPPNINKELSRNFVEDKTSPDGVSLEREPGLPGSQSHGTGTIGILAGGPIELVDTEGKTLFSGPLGGAPGAEILPMRVATSVVHLENPLIKTRPSGTARAILYAIRQHCDVISMSHGGLPSRALADAVNAAYEAGLAMFFASGDYLQPPGSPLHTPRYVVFPAAFSRAMCVCGATADNKTYGYPPGDYDSTRGPVGSWRLRGNWGPAVWMKNAIATFSPNIPWPHLPNPKAHETAENLIDLDGQGTSASTPQAAAAAALWLQYHAANDRLKPHWRTWRKAESVYAALRNSAKRGPDTKYSADYFGNGILQASEALAQEPPQLQDKDKQKQATVGLGWLRLFTSLTGGTRADGGSDEILKQMFGLELAQLAQRSIPIQDLMERYGGYDPDDDAAPPPADFANFRKELFEQIKNDARASRHLKEAVGKEIGSR
jgi:hypothetical protein